MAKPTGPRIATTAQTQRDTPTSWADLERLGRQMDRDVWDAWRHQVRRERWADAAQRREEVTRGNGHNTHADGA